MQGLNGYWLEIIFSLVSALIFWIIHHLQGEVKKYKKLLDKQENEVMENLITSKLEPIKNDISLIIHRIDAYDIKARRELEQNAKYYGILLQDDCEKFLNRGYVTHKEFNRTSELLHIYEGLGGDGKIHDLWQKVINLPLKDEEK